jgi:hypothetical protein
MRDDHCCSVTLIVVGDDLEPDVVTSVLGWLPNKSWRRGEHKRVMQPDGNERVFDSIHDWGVTSASRIPPRSGRLKLSRSLKPSFRPDLP